MKNDIADILFKYTTGEATLEETNDALKEAEAGFNLEPGRNEITPDEMALTTVGDTPGEANGFGLLDTGTGSMEKVHVTNGKLDEAINQVNHDGTTNMLAFVIIGPNRYEVKGDTLTDCYTGTLTGSKTYAKRQKDIDQMLERGELLTMEEFFEVWTEWKNTKYHTRKHRGLSDAGEKWVTPIEMFENGPRYEKAAPPREYAAMLLMKAATARVTNQGINKFGTLYTDTELAYYVNQKVNIKWDIDDVTKLYTITDVEGDNVVVTEFVDDDEIRSYQATLGEEATIELTREKWLTLANGTHQLRVEAVDGNFATSVRAWIFSKAENTIAFQFSAPEETDARATKILITPTWKIEGAVAKVEACNNAFDAVPTWEDITAMVQLNRVFNFTNETKTADKWGVNVRFTIVKNEGYEGEVSISGFGGAYE